MISIILSVVFSVVELSSQHVQKVAEVEQAMQQKLRERQKVYEEAFNQDMKQYMSTGYVEHRGEQPFYPFCFWGVLRYLREVKMIQFYFSWMFCYCFPNVQDFTIHLMSNSRFTFLFVSHSVKGNEIVGKIILGKISSTRANLKGIVKQLYTGLVLVY